MNIIQLLGYVSCIIVIIAMVKNNKKMVSESSNNFESDEVTLDDIDIV